MFASKSTAALFGFVLVWPALAQKPWSGTPEIEQALRRVNVLGSVLMIAAHPDDENTAVLAYFARGRGIRTAYLSATRGEGGQNLIGPEQGDALGVIRTQELLAARRIDGAEQFFTRAIDFGFTKSADETIAKWGRERIVADMTWVIRRYRPDVVMVRFSGTSRDGHGQHYASSILGREAYNAAGDPARFPEQLRLVSVWRPKRLVWNTFSFTAEQERQAAALPSRVEVDTGEFNPVLGRSYNEIAGMSRSLHRSQGMGSPERRGSSRNYFVHVAGEPARQDLFDGVDTTWNRVPGGAEIGKLTGAALAAFRPERPEAALPALAKARPLIAALRDPWAAVKLKEVDEAMALCAGLWLSADADGWAAVPGSRVSVRVTALNRSPAPVTLEKMELNGAGVSVGKSLAYNQPFTSSLEGAAGNAYSQPFWLETPHGPDYYEISNQELIGVAENPPAMKVRFTLRVAGTEVALDRPVEYRYVDRVGGERTRPLAVTPPVAFNFPQQSVLFPSPAPKRVDIEALAIVRQSGGEARLEAPARWTSTPASRPFPAGAAGEQHALQFQVAPDGGAAMARVLAGGAPARGLTVISYPHIPPQVLLPRAEVRLVRADVRVTARKVGYVMGAGDEVPDALRQLGCEVTLLAPSDLAERPLGEFDAIVAGVRAYNTRADLRANHARLMQYVSGGGTYIVQYNVAEGALGNIGPYSVSLGRERVSVEDAPVTFPDPASALLHTPNEITARDFEGWVQERGLYFASRWDPRYHTVMASHDPGEEPLAGGELWTRYGKGVYIFTAYSWFRQLPAGVPGAYRLFANLLSAK
ncbi:MAG: PIG-L family deacetylase [Bryobacteraceae bacterium]